MIVPPGILLNLAFAKSGVQTAGRAAKCADASGGAGWCMFVTARSTLMPCCHTCKQCRRPAWPGPGPLKRHKILIACTQDIFGNTWATQPALRGVPNRHCNAFVIPVAAYVTETKPHVHFLTACRQLVQHHPQQQLQVLCCVDDGPAQHPSLGAVGEQSNTMKLL
jgi:hypothetical protein